MSRQQDYIDAVLADAPVAYWVLDDASGFPQDSSGNGNHTTAERTGTGATVARTNSGPADGSTRSTLTHGHNFEVTYPVITNVDDFTMEVWLGDGWGQNPVGSPALSVLAIGRNAAGGSTGSPANGYSLGLDSSAHLGVDVSGGSGSPGTVGPSDGTIALWGANCVRGIGTPGPDRKWSHCLVIRRSGTWEYWVDGVSEHPALLSTFTPTAPTTETRLFNGNFSAVGSPTLVSTQFDAAHIAVYDFPLSSARILAHYAIMAAPPDGDYPFLSFLNAGGGAQAPASGRISIV